MSLRSFGFLDSVELESAELDSEEGAPWCGPAAVVVPVDEYRRLRALERRATEADLDVAEADAIMQGHREWTAAGRPGAVSHEEAMAELLHG